MEKLRGQWLWLVARRNDALISDHVWEYNVVVTTTPDQGCGDLDLGLRDTGDEIVAI